MRLYYTDGVFSMSLNQFEINLNQFEPCRSGSVTRMLLLHTVTDDMHMWQCRQPDPRPSRSTFCTVGLGYVLAVARMLQRETQRVSKCHEEQQDVDDLYERSCQRAENEERQPGYLR